MQPANYLKHNYQLLQAISNYHYDHEPKQSGLSSHFIPNFLGHDKKLKDFSFFQPDILGHWKPSNDSYLPPSCRVAMSLMVNTSKDFRHCGKVRQFNIITWTDWTMLWIAKSVSNKNPKVVVGTTQINISPVSSSNFKHLADIVGLFHSK